MAQQKKWYKSKTKWAGVLAGVGVALAGVTGWLNGGVFPLVDLYYALIAVLAVFGIRDLPLLNK